MGQTASQPATPQKVFVSYSHDTPAPRQRVMDLVARALSNLGENAGARAEPVPEGGADALADRSLSRIIAWALGGEG